LEPVHSIGDFVFREGRAGLVEVLDALAEAVIIASPEGEIEFANRAAAVALGAGKDARLAGARCASALREWLLRDEQGNELDGEQLLRGEISSTAIHAVHRGSGEVRWWRPGSRPLRDAMGDEVARLVALDDVTAVKEAEMRMRVLADSGRALVASLDYEQTLFNVAHMAVPALADWCAVYLADEALNVRRVVVAHRNPAKQEVADRLRELQGERVDPHSALGAVIRSGDSHLIEEISDEQLTQRARTAEELRLTRALALRSLLIVPMRVPTRTIGAMVLATDDDSGRRLTYEDRELAEQLGRRAAVATENARLYGQLAEVAETLARSFLPSELPDVPGWEVASMYRPMVSEQRIDLGGDFVELLAVGSRWFAVIGDIEGKGVVAATISALMRHGTRLAAQQRPEAASVLAQLDEALRNYPSEITCTMLCARLGRANMTVASAGHPPPLVASADGVARELQVAGPLLGAFGDASWRQQRFGVRTGELVLLYTDGVTEALGGRRGIGRDRLRRLLCEQAGRRPAEVVDALNNALAATVVRDDLAALVLRRR
jgi:serine phosphatase RsbU (regulator of sigma subunit)